MDPFDKDYFGQTVLSPIGLIAVLVLGLAMLLLPRRRATWPMLAMACFIPPAQRIAVLTLNFDLLRILLLFGTARILLRAEWKALGWKRMDTVWVAFCCYGVGTLMFMYGSSEVLKNQLGFLYDSLGMYFLFRCLVRTWEDVDQIIAAAIAISVPVAAAFIVEHATARNLFAFMGGVPLITMVRDDRLRCQGAFAHPILAGCFWAALIPLMALWWWPQGRKRVASIIGVVTSSTIIVMCASSTPVAAIMFSLIAASCFVIRQWMRAVRWGILAMLVVLHLAMKAPVWNLIARIDLAGGSTGWHRYYLIDSCIRHFDEWWLVGSTTGTAHWGYGMVDVTNDYIVQCLHGGIGLLLLFILVFVTGFQGVGQMIRAAGNDVVRLRRAWALGICLFAHMTNFIAVSYFGQINMIWYLLLATIANMTPVNVANMARRMPPIRRAFPSAVSIAVPGRTVARVN